MNRNYFYSQEKKKKNKAFCYVLDISLELWHCVSRMGDWDGPEAAGRRPRGWAGEDQA